MERIQAKVEQLEEKLNFAEARIERDKAKVAEPAVELVEELKKSYIDYISTPFYSTTEKYKKNHVRLKINIEQTAARIAQLEADCKTLKKLWVRAQTACKKHALRGDRLEGENKLKAEMIGKMHKDIRKQNNILAEQAEEIKLLKDLLKESEPWVYQWSSHVSDAQEQTNILALCVKVKQALKDKECEKPS